MERARTEADLRLGCQPHQHARGISAEIWDEIKDKDWSLVGGGAVAAVEHRQDLSAR